MKTNVSISSIEAHDAILGYARTMQHDRIIAHMKLFDRAITRKELAKALDMEPGTIAGRVNELIQLGRIDEVGRKVCDISNRTVGAIRLSICEGA